MKFTKTFSVLIVLASSHFAFAQSGTMKDLDMQHCMDMKGMKDMKMSDMDMQKCHDMMKGMDHQQSAKDAKTIVHHATAVVKSADAANGKVTLAHGPVKSLNWPSMTMTFAVKDKALFDKLMVDKKVDVDFVQQGKDYVVTGVQ